MCELSGDSSIGCDIQDTGINRLDKIVGEQIGGY